MTLKDLGNKVLKDAANIKIAVIGDFCLDKYLYIDERLDEPSIETGETAYQVIGKGIYPGGAGTVANNLRALTAQVICIGVTGDDGEGYELNSALKKIGANTDLMITDPNRCTSTYTKPMKGIPDQKNYRELNRLDFKNFAPMSKETETKVIENLEKAAKEVNAIIVLDQFVEENCGVINANVRTALMKIAKKNANLIIYADSRAFIHLFKNVIVKCNNFEVVKSVNPSYEGEPDENAVLEYGAKLYELNKKPVFVTMGSKGIRVFDNNGMEFSEAYEITGPIDICGAGDAATSGIVLGLALGAQAEIAAGLGNTVASITIQQIGVTGTATPAQVISRINEKV